MALGPLISTSNFHDSQLLVNDNNNCWVVSVALWNICLYIVDQDFGIVLMQVLVCGLLNLLQKLSQRPCTTVLDFAGV